MAPDAQPSLHAQASSPRTDSSDWLGRRDVARIPGALKAGAYVARAYLHQKEHGGTPPSWARKLPGGQWQFARPYIEADAADNQAAIGISEAARLLGASRRAVQTWTDEGLLPTLADGRQSGEVRRIERAAFLQRLPELKARLATAHRLRHGDLPEDEPAPPHGRTPSGAPSEADFTVALEHEVSAVAGRMRAETERKLAEAATARERLAQDRAEAERRLQELAEAERRLAAREAELQADYNARLQETQRESRDVDRQRAAAARAAARSAAREAEARAREQKLRDSLATRLAAWQRRGAAMIAAQLQEARAKWRRPADAKPAPTATPSDERRRRSAAAVVQQLRTARDTHQRTTALAQEVDQIAARLAEEVAAGRRDRYDAAIFFNSVMDQRNVPADMRIAAMRKHFHR